MDFAVIILFLNQVSNPGNLQTRVVRRRRPQVFRPRLDLAYFYDSEIVATFRLSKNAIMELYGQIRHLIDNSTAHSHAVPGLTKLLAVLNCFATGSFQNNVSSCFGFSQPTFSRILRQVTSALLKLLPIYIYFPTSRDDIQTVKQQFFSKAGFPNVLSVIGCTHVALIPPLADEEIYRNRRLYTSINVQVTCGPNLKITDIVAKFPGSTHDAFILDNCHLARKFNAGCFGESVILGNNGYRLMPWLLTPYLNPVTTKQEQYNVAHRRTLCIIEQVFGILKSRFRCLDFPGGALLYSPKMVCQIICCCAILHNIALSHNLDIAIATDLREHISHQGLSLNDADEDGQAVRASLTEQFF